MAALNPLAVQKYKYPISSLNPDAGENIAVGKKIHTLPDYDKYKNSALASLAIGTIFVVGALVAFSTGQLALSAAFNYTGLALAMTGAIYFVFRHFFNPYSKIEAQREKMRTFPLDRILEDSLENIEGYDLLKKAIEDKTQDPQDKIKVYLVLRQLKRNCENIDSLKKHYEHEVETRYLEAMEELQEKKDENMKTFCARHPQAASQQIQTEMRVIDRSYKMPLEKWQIWKKDSMSAIRENHDDVIDRLEREYQKRLNDLGKKSSLFDFKFW